MLVRRDISGFWSIFPTVVLAWILVELWSNVINVFVYKYLGLKIDSFITSVVIAVIVTIALYFSMCIHQVDDNDRSVEAIGFSDPVFPGTYTMEDEGLPYYHHSRRSKRKRSHPVHRSHRRSGHGGNHH
jgi:hypothetical protein